MNTIARAQAWAAGAAGSSAEAEALGRSKGGFTARIHAITDALGNPLDFILTAGQASDVGQTEALLQLTPAGAGALLGDKGGARQRCIRPGHPGQRRVGGYSASQQPHCAARR